MANPNFALDPLILLHLSPTRTSHQFACFLAYDSNGSEVT